METEFASRLDWNQRAYYALHGREIMVGNCRKLESRPLPSPSCYLFGSNARMCREPRHMGITTSLPAATEINCHGRRANLFPWTGVYHVYWLPRAITADRVYVPWPVLFRISQNWIRQPVERERADERTVRRECPRPECGFIYSYLSTRCSVEIDRAKPPPIVAIRRDYRCV